MRVMYIMPRFHTNLIPTMSQWIENGHEVIVVTYTTGKIEDYSKIAPIVVGYSRRFRMFRSVYLCLRKNDPLAANIAIKLGEPPRREIEKILKEYLPDLVILRERNLYSIVCTSVCRKYGFPTLLYNQSPLWAEPTHIKNDLAHRIVNSLTPSRRITPVYKIWNSSSNIVKDDRAEFAPFVMTSSIDISDKRYFYNECINILEIGKYEERKNHFLMIDAFSRLLEENDDIRLTIVGENSNSFHSEYFARLINYVESLGISEYVCLKYNLNRNEISAEYRKADIFVLPSSGEPAAISPIEAMSYGVAAISTSNNGTADYIVDGKTGYIFEDGNCDSLVNKLKYLISDSQKIISMGKNAFERVKEYCTFDNYYNAVISQMKLIH